MRTPLILAALSAALLAGCKGANRGTMGNAPGAATADTTTMRTDTGMAGMDTSGRAATSDTGMRPTGRTDTVNKKAGGTRVTGARTDTALKAAPGTQTGPRKGQPRDTSR